MNEVEIAIPDSLGLSEEQIKQLAEKFKCELVDVVNNTGQGTPVEVEVRPKIKNQVV
jgi:hypothetical protein